jgi:lipoate-protein ligase A
MYHLALTLETPAANLALDEQLLAWAESEDVADGLLRLWESAQPIVVMGRSSPEREVHSEACRRDGVPILRRASGGSSVVLGPGCLAYALILARRRHSELRGVDGAHHFALDRLVAALAPLADGVARAGTSDLVLPSSPSEPPRKFSGNSLRIKRTHLLYHGTILYDFALANVARWLAAPQRAPEYRRSRDHGAFLINFPATRTALEQALINAWQATTPLPWRELPFLTPDS